MNDKKMEYSVDMILLIGLLLYVIYSLINRFLVTIPDVVAIPWMIISCICMLIGVFRTGQKLKRFFNK